MVSNKKFRLLSSHSISIGLAFVLVALIAGIYFLFKPFPASPGLGVKANAPVAAGVHEAATVNHWYEYANPPEEIKGIGVKLPQLDSSPGQKVSPGQGLAKGFMLGGKLFPKNP